MKPKQALREDEAFQRLFIERMKPKQPASSSPSKPIKTVRRLLLVYHLAIRIRAAMVRNVVVDHSVNCIVPITLNDEEPNFQGKGSRFPAPSQQYRAGITLTRRAVWSPQAEQCLHCHYRKFKRQRGRAVFAGGYPETVQSRQRSHDTILREEENEAIGRDGQGR
jgi:hypothetical protein